MKEIFKPVKFIYSGIPYDFTGYYEVSNHGTLKSVKRESVNCNGKRLVYKAKVLKGSVDGDGYSGFILCKSKTDRLRLRLHQIVLLVFTPQTNPEYCVNHKDGDKSNNRLDNLEWLSYADNNKHAYATGLKIPFEGIKGETNNKSKLTTEQVNEIRKIYSTKGISQKKIGDIYNVKQSTIYNIVNRVTWKHI